MLELTAEQKNQRRNKKYFEKLFSVTDLTKNIAEILFFGLSLKQNKGFSFQLVENKLTYCLDLLLKQN